MKRSIKKVIKAYHSLPEGTFSVLYKKLLDCGGNGEVCILFGVKDGIVYGGANFFDNPEPFYIKGKHKKNEDLLIACSDFMNSAKKLRANK